MGYSFSVYTVDLKQLKPNKSAEFWTEIVEENEDDFEDNFESFEDEIVTEGAPILKRALWLLLNKKDKDLPKSHGFQYGYALELLVKHLGQRVDNEELSWFDEALDPFLKKARCPDVEAMLGRGTLPMKFPRPDDFPEIGTVTYAGCISALGSLATIKPMAKAADDDDALELIDEVTGWFEAAKKAKTGLVWFIY